SDTRAPTVARFLKEKPDIIRFARYPELRWLYSKTFFGGFEMRRFDFIGFLEHYERDLATLARLLNLPLVPERKNVTTLHPALARRRWYILASPRIQAELTEILADDLAFYAYCSRLPVSDTGSLNPDNPPTQVNPLIQ